MTSNRMKAIRLSAEATTCVFQWELWVILHLKGNREPRWCVTGTTLFLLVVEKEFHIPSSCLRFTFTPSPSQTSPSFPGFWCSSLSLLDPGNSLLISCFPILSIHCLPFYPPLHHPPSLLRLSCPSSSKFSSGRAVATIGPKSWERKLSSTGPLTAMEYSRVGGSQMGEGAHTFSSNSSKPAPQVPVQDCGSDASLPSPKSSGLWRSPFLFLFPLP